MDKEIENFFNVLNSDKILIISQNQSIENNKDDNLTNITINTNTLEEYDLLDDDYDLIVFDEVILKADMLDYISKKNEIPLIICEKSSSDENIEDSLIKHGLNISSLNSNDVLIYDFKVLDSLLNNQNIMDNVNDELLDKIYENNYVNNHKKSSSISDIISLFIHSNKIGGLKNLPVNVKGYKKLLDEDNLDIGYYLRRNNIKDCDNVKLHYLYNAADNDFNPNSHFNRANYLKVNPDLKNIEYDPFLHYIVYGKNENRESTIFKGAFQTNINDGVLKGWIAEIGNNNPVDAKISIDDKIYPIRADIYREDLKKNKINLGKHAFIFKVPDEYKDGNNHRILLLNERNSKVAEIKYNYLTRIEEVHDSKSIKGALQSNIKGSIIKGWIAEINNYSPVKATISIDGKEFPVIADLYREDLKQHGINDGYHAFEFKVPNEFIDGNEHKIELIGPNYEKIRQISHVFAKYDYENNIERYFANSMLEPEIIIPTTESRKKILAVMNNIKKYLLTQVDDMPLVSVIMPVYNREELIKNAIESVLKQSYKNFELIIVDDNSSDNTVESINSFDDDRIRLLRNKTNMGVSKSRNIALSESKGKYIMYLDSDNNWEKDYIKATVGAFTLLKDADALYSGQYVYENDKNNLKYIRYGTINKGLLLNRNYVDLNCFSHTRDIYEQEGGFDEELDRFVDWDLTLKYMTYGKIYSVPIIESNYYINISDNAISNQSQLLSQSDTILEKQIARLNNKEYEITMKHGVSVIIPSYESLDDLKKCLESLFGLEASWLEIIVVDNNSSEDIIRYLIQLKDEGKIKLILNKENLGFTFAVNQGIEIAKIENDIVLLNNDAVVTENAIQLLQKAAYELENCGMTVPQQVLPANTKTINVHVPFANRNVECDVNLSAHHKNILDVPLFHDGENTEISFAPFFCVYIKRDTYNMSIGLDAELGRHFRSDMIYCNYVRTVLKQKIYHVSEARVYHKLQQATETLKEKSLEEHELLYIKNRWSEEEQVKYGFKRAKWDID